MHPYIQYQSAGARVAGMRRLAGTRRRGRLLVRLAVALPLAAAGLGTAVLVSAPAQAAATTTTFSYTGGEQAYPVPAGVTAVTVTAIGGHGGFGSGFAGAGAPGAVVTATVPVPRGVTTLYVEVGGAGDAGGFNGGGLSGGLSGLNSGGLSSGGNGGGASDVRTTSIATVPDSALTTASDSRLVVAGGGGGGGSGVNGIGGCNNPGGDGGTGGDTTVSGPGNGGAGTTLCGQAYGGGDGGLGGTAGGAGGTGSFGCSGGSGSLGQGGQSVAFETSCGAAFAGGGGGGYYGGGAGGDTFTAEAVVDFVGGGGGGAGSSYWVPGATGTSMSENTTSQPAQVQVTPVIPAVTTTTTTTSSANPSVPGQQVTYTATVSPVPDGGTVAFTDGGTTITGCGAHPADTGTGTATCQVTYTAAGSHSITAVYSGDTGYAGSTSAALTQRVVPDKADLRVKLSVPARARDGAGVTETVTVTNGGPATASNVVTALTEPRGLTVTSADGATVKGRVLTWSTASLPSGASLTFTVTARAGARGHGTMLVAARALSATPDPELGNNTVISRIRLG